MVLLSGCGGNDPTDPPKDPPPHPQPTPAPTPAPTPDPTPAPTSAPTTAPTPAPTSAPTSAPTPAPTSAPTSAPTPAPTPAPTEDPTPAPNPDNIALDSKLTPLISSTLNSQPPWPDGAGTGKPIDGVNCASSELYHLHALVSLYKDGVRLGLPQEIGLKGCTYELHTHDRTGIVHVEAEFTKVFTYGQFFAVWGKEITRASVAGLSGPRYYLIENGKITPFNGDPATIRIARHRELLIVVGKAPSVVPNYQWPSGL